MDIRHHSPNSADDPVRWIFFVDVVDGQEQRLHGKPAATKFLSCRTCTRGSDCDSVPGVSDSGRCGGSARLPAVVRTARRATLGDSYFGWILFLRTATEYREGQRSCLPDLFGRSRSRHCRGHSWCGTAQSSSTGLGVESAHIHHSLRFGGANTVCDRISRNTYLVWVRQSRSASRSWRKHGLLTDDSCVSNLTGEGRILRHCRTAHVTSS